MNVVTRAKVETDSKPWVTEVTENEILVDGILGDFSLWVSKHDKSLTPSIMLNGFWESWITAWCYNNVREHWNVLDVGANCGYYTMLFERLTGSLGQVYAYEANPHYAELLKRTRTTNEANFEIINLALSDSIGEVELHVPGDLTGSASIVSDWKDDDRHEDWSITVPTTTLDNEANAGRFWMPDLIKMDVEGAEELVWNGGHETLSQAPLVMMEYTPGAYSDGFNAALFEYGHVTRIDEQGEEAPVDDAHLRNLTDWDMLVVRKFNGSQI